MSRIVAPGASQRDVIDAINMVAGKLVVGEVTLGAGTATTVTDPNIGPRSAVLFMPVVGGAPYGVGGGDGSAQLVHETDSQGQVYRYVIFNR